MSKSLNSGLRFIGYIVNGLECRTNQRFEERNVSVKFNVFRDVEYLDDENNTMLVLLIVSVFEGAEEKSIKNFKFKLAI